jgi:hypothetical protein
MGKNVIKYSTGSTENTIRKGNFHLGVNNVGYGPTETTGFWNTIEPPLSGYTIYGNKNDNLGPSISVVNNDSELINWAISMGAPNISTVSDALSWINSNNDMLVANKDYENIVTDGLVLNLDAGFSASYPKSGNVWLDTSGNNISGTTINNPVFDSDWGGSLYFNNVTQKVTLVNNNLLNASGNNISMEVFVKFTQLDYTGSTGNLFFFYTKGGPDSVAPNNGVYFSYDNRGNAKSFTYTCFGNSNGGFAGGGNNFGGSSYDQIFIPNTWHHIAFTIENSVGKLYIDGVQKGPSKTFNNLSFSSSTVPEMARATDTVTPSYPKISNFKVYNRALTSEEILQNYNNFFYQYINNLENRVESDNGVFEDYNNNTTNALSDINILDKASWVLTPTAYKEDKLYAIVPKDGSGDLTVTRATTATRVNSEGFVETVPYNLITYSEDFNQWSKSNSTITQNATMSPYGDFDADKIVSMNGTGRIACHQAPVTKTGQTYTASVYLKAAEWKHAVLFVDQILVLEGAYYASGVKLDLTGGTSTHPSIVSISPVIDGWYLAKITATPTDYYFRMAICPLNSSSVDVNTIVGDGVSGIYVWGAQLVEGSNPKSYQPTLDRLDVPRINYPYTGGSPSILIEPQRTNLLLYSEQFENSYWSKARCFVESNQAIAPNGLIVADKIVADGGSDPIVSRATTISGGLASKNFTFSIWLWTDSEVPIQNAQLFLYGNVGLEDIVSLTIPQLNTYPARYSLTISFNATPSSTQIQSRFDIGATAGVVDSINYHYAWGAQLEEGSYPTSYIPTTTSTLTRNADVISKTAASNLIGQSEGSIFVDYNYEKNDPNDNFICTLSDGSGNNGIWLDVNQSGVFVAIIRVSGVSAVVFTVSAVNFTFGRKKIVFNYKSGDTSLYINGVQIGSTSNESFTFPVTIGQINLGSFWNGAAQLNGIINNAFLSLTPMSATESIQLTTL